MCLETKLRAWNASEKQTKNVLVGVKRKQKGFKYSEKEPNLTFFE